MLQSLAKLNLFPSCAGEIKDACTNVSTYGFDWYSTLNAYLPGELYIPT